MRFLLCRTLDLKKLDIQMRGGTSGDLKLSPLSVTYGFSLMKKLEVNMEIHHTLNSEEELSKFNFIIIFDKDTIIFETMALRDSM